MGTIGGKARSRAASVPAWRFQMRTMYVASCSGRPGSGTLLCSARTKTKATPPDLRRSFISRSLWLPASVSSTKLPSRISGGASARCPTMLLGRCSRRKALARSGSLSRARKRASCGFGKSGMGYRYRSGVCVASAGPSEICSTPGAGLSGVSTGPVWRTLRKIWRHPAHQWQWRSAGQPHHRTPVPASRSRNPPRRGMGAAPFNTPLTPRKAPVQGRLRADSAALKPATLWRRKPP